MSYIFEMDVTRLRIQYLLPDDLFCVEIRTVLNIDKPYDGTNLSMNYWCAIRSEYTFKENGSVDNCKVFKSFEAESLQELVSKCRRWLIDKRENEQEPVNNL